MEVNLPYPNIPLLEAVALEQPLAVLLLRLAVCGWTGWGAGDSTYSSEAEEELGGSD